MELTVELANTDAFSLTFYKTKVMSLKDTIHQLVEECNDETVLSNTIEILEQSKNRQDWWQELSEEQRQLTLTSLEQSANDETVSHEILRGKIWAKFSK